MASAKVVDLTLTSDDDEAASASTKSPDTVAVKKFSAAMPPGAAAAAIFTKDQPRRSARDHQSKKTIIWIDGHAVKKSNNYSVTGGEYIYHDNALYDTVSPRQKRKAAAAGDANKKPKAAVRQPRKVSPREYTRRAHNNAVKDSKHKKLGRRRAFLQSHAVTLQPFLEDRVYQELLLGTKKEKRSTTVGDSVRSTQVAQPSLVTGGVLRDYQIEGLQFLVHHHVRNLGMILGDEMGLGKTLQTISLLSYLKETEKKRGPSLVVCPLSVLSSWMREIKYWAPSLKVFRLHNSSAAGQAKNRQDMMDSFLEFDVVLTTYDMVKTPPLKYLFNRLHFHYLVLDEGHKVKCNETLVAGAVRKIHCENRLILTGTPLQNNMVELWSLLELLYPEIFTTKKPFEMSFDLSHNLVDKEMLVHAQNILELFMIRRLKSRVEKLLPPKLETQVYCPLSKEQVFLYKAILMKDASFLHKVNERLNNGDDDAEDGDEKLSQTNRQLLQNIFMQLRKASQHPWIFDGMQSPDANLEDMVAASGKLAVLDMLLRSLCNKGHRVVIFSQFTTALDILEDYCYERGWNHARFDGGTSRAKRDYLVNRFNEKDSPFFLFLMSTKAGGVGLNLQTADTCILFDSDWNPQNDLQAMARVHRIGQKAVVHVYRLVTSNSVEERMVERANKKLLLDHSVNRESSASVKDADIGLGAKTILNDIKFGAGAIFGEKTLQDLPSWNDIDYITDRNRTESDSLGKLKGGTEQNGATFDAEKQFSDGQVFGGIDFRSIRQEQERNSLNEAPKTLKGISHLWQSIKEIEGKKRQKKSRLVIVDGIGSGYGNSHVPVLASNNYDLLAGESSVFGRELKCSQKKLAAVPSKKGRAFQNHSYCQVCLDGGSLVCCPLCPVSLHLQCCGIKRSKDFQKCMHHRCVTCNKNLQEAGGLLYPCAICPWAYCDGCLPRDNPGFRYLGSNERFEKLGFDSAKNAVYVHCSAECEKYAKKEYHWKPRKSRQACPKELDISYNFGVKCDLTAANSKDDGEKANKPLASDLVDLNDSQESATRGDASVSLERNPAAADVTSSSSSSDGEDDYQV